MKPRVLFSLLISAQFVASYSCLGDDGAARRYGLMRDDDLLLMCCLLNRPDVQSELKLSAEQVARVKRVWCATAGEIPGLKELARSCQEQQSAAALSAAEKEKLAKSANAALKSHIESYERRELSAMLSAGQTNRLDELLTQMVGPIAILNKPSISSKLQLIGKQAVEVAKTSKHYEAGLGWLRARYGRQQVSGLHKDESQQDRHKELEALFVVIRAIEKERDADLLAELTPSQVVSWHQIQGKPFPIAWPPTSISDCVCD